MKYIVSLVMIIALTGCNTVPGAFSSGTHSLEGVVYTGSGAPLRDVELTLDGHPPVWSDVNGRFTIPRVKLGEHRISAHHDSHEAIDLPIRFSRPTDVLYLRLRSAAELVRAAQLALDRGETSGAEELIARALSIGPNSMRVRYLAAIVYTSAGRFDDARLMLDHPVFDSASPAVELLAERFPKEDSQ